MTKDELAEKMRDLISEAVASDLMVVSIFVETGSDSFRVMHSLEADSMAATVMRILARHIGGDA